MIDFINQNNTLINSLSTFILVIITAYYAYITRKILSLSAEQAKLSSNPVIGIKINEIEISPKFGPDRRQLTVSLVLSNVGNAPAISVFVDAEIELSYSNIDGEKSIPARHEPGMISFIKPDEEVEDFHPNFGNRLVTHFFDDERESLRLNLHRIETNPTQESYNGSKLRVFVYYTNSVGQFFKSCYEAHIDIFCKLGEDPIPKDDENCEVSLTYIPRPVFKAFPVEKKIMDQDINNRNKKRKLCGW